jgi:YD repeat-containing protein
MEIGFRQLKHFSIDDDNSWQIQKWHFKHDEQDSFFLPVDKATFLNELAKTLQVYQEATSQTEEYQYDAAGNRTLVKMTLVHADLRQSEYYPNSDRLKTDGKYTYTYDDAGNMAAKSGIA